MSTKSTVAGKNTSFFEVGDYVIVRADEAGVLFGKYFDNDGSTIYLSEARQLWHWHAANGGTLVDVATLGVKQDECKFSTATAGKTIVFSACALIGVTDEAAKSIRETPAVEWR